MSRIRPVSRDEAREDVRQYYDKEVEAFGAPLNTTQVFAHSPDVLRAAKGIGVGIAKAGRIDKGLSALLCVRVATQVGCAF